ncbi:MAG: hypothetical protein R3213_06950 [Flavobacteriaceae bacterium]|nr:hypothetical protein [Flavobacteriaceae bacterium]
MVNDSKKPKVAYPIGTPVQVIGHGREPDSEVCYVVGHVCTLSGYFCYILDRAIKMKYYALNEEPMSGKGYEFREWLWIHIKVADPRDVIKTRYANRAR